MDGPCRLCAKRYPGCHSTCEAYISYTQELQEHKRQRAERNKLENDINGYIIQHYERSRRRK